MELVKKRIGQYKEIYSKCEVREEIIEVIVPDSNPDCEYASYTFASCRTNEKSILSGTVRVSGELKIKVQYSALASEKMYTVESTAPLSYSFDAGDLQPEDRLILSINVAEATSETINSRKIRIRVKLNACISVMRLDNCEVSEDIIYDAQECICSKCDEHTKELCVDVAEKHISFTEEIPLDEGDIASLYKILKQNCTWSSSEIKVMQNKLMLRGKATLNVYGCRDDSWESKCHTYTLPFSQIIECRNAFEGDSADVIYSPRCVDVKIDFKEDDKACLVCELSADAVAFVNRKSNFNK